jgi:hypothetical protein
MAFKDLVPPKITAREHIKLTARKKGGHAVTVSPDLAARLKIAKGSKCQVMIDTDSRPAVVRIIVGKGKFVVAALKGAAVLFVGMLPGVKIDGVKGVLCEWDEDADGENRMMIDVELPVHVMRGSQQQPIADHAAARPAGDSLIHAAARRVGVR